MPALLKWLKMSKCYKMHSFQWKSISWENTNICTAKDYHKKTPTKTKHKWKASHTTLVLQILPCIYVRISSLARALLCGNKRLAFHTSQEANVHDTCLSSVSQRKLTCQEDEIVYPYILWRTMVKIKTQTSANEATSGAAASSQRQAEQHWGSQPLCTELQRVWNTTSEMHEVSGAAQNTLQNAHCYHGQKSSQSHVSVFCFAWSGLSYSKPDMCT